MPAWICVTCGVQYPDTDRHPRGCPICEDERQYVGWQGQQWTTMAEIAGSHRVVVRNEETDLVGVGVEPSFAIGQRALLVRTPHGNVLWDCISLLDEQARGQIADLGGIAAICLSHPHFYAANVEFADAFDAHIFIPRADQHWIQRPSPRIELFDDDIEPVPGLTVARIGGHFDGAAVLHWPAGCDQRGALLTGDTITVVQDRDWVSSCGASPTSFPSIRPPSSTSPAGSNESPSTGSTAAGGDGSLSRTEPAPFAAPPTATSYASTANDHQGKRVTTARADTVSAPVRTPGQTTRTPPSHTSSATVIFHCESPRSRDERTTAARSCVVTPTRSPRRCTAELDPSGMNG
jgi:hypothetical protein